MIFGKKTKLPGNPGTNSYMMTWKELEKFNGKKVFITGHTGFKGSWLTFILKKAGAEVHGYSDKYLGDKSNFQILKIQTSETIADIKDYKKLSTSISEFKPDFLFHLAAQPIVKLSHENPYDTFITNTLGTLNILEVIRNNSQIKSAVIITTDKVYRNNESNIPFKEVDPLGGNEPYSGSKAAAEIICETYNKTYFLSQNKNVIVARGGNVFGGGDFGEHRLIPDLFKSLENNIPLELRSPESTRPWIYVLEILSAYLSLALNQKKSEHCYNISYSPKSISVLDFLSKFKNHLNFDIKIEQNKNFKESTYLNLDSSLIVNDKIWQPKQSIEKSIKSSVDWYTSNDKINFSNQIVNDFFS
jgi:CDP-glucose 4,6-dehydratase